MPGGQDEPVRRDVVEGDLLQGGQGVIARRDEHGRIGEDRAVDDVARRVEHRPHREVDAVGPQPLEPFAARDVVRPDLGARVFRREPFDEPRQQVEDGRFTGRDVDLAGVEAPAALGERVGKAVDAFHQRRGKLVQRAALRRERDSGATALEQHRIHLLLQRLDLKRHRRLAEVHALRRLGDAQGSHHVTERPELLEPVLLVVEAPCGHRMSPRGSPSRLPGSRKQRRIR